MENLLQFIDLMRYFGDLDTATAFCEYLYNTPYNNSAHAISACKYTWIETFNYVDLK